MFSTLYDVIDELKEIYPDFEERKEQMDMWESVYTSMVNGEKAAIHAPTGTGKSLGYILPFIARKLEDQKFKMTVSTFTINLQEQLKKDLELGIKIYQNILKKRGTTGKRITYVALKGQKNYFCKKRFLEFSPGELDSAKVNLVDKRLKEITDWDRQNLNIPFSFKEWETMQVDHCIKRQCPLHHGCTYFNHYNALDENDVVIANHSLWFTRFYFVEPWEKFHFFVFDEGHKLEKVLLETYTFDLSMNKFEKWIEQGEKIALKYGGDEHDVSDWRENILHHHSSIMSARDYFRRLEIQMSNPNATLGELKLPNQGAKQLVLDMSLWQKDMYEGFNGLVSKEAKDSDEMKEDLKAWVRNLLELKEFAMLAMQEKEVGLFWVEKDSKDQAILKITPNDIHHIPSPFIRGSLVTSGTLAENRSCQSFGNRMRMELDTDLVLNSPFPLAEQTTVYIAEHVNPKKPDYEALLEEEIFKLLQVGKQKAFVLFTSNRLMWAMFKKLNGKLRSMETYNEQPMELWIQDKNNHKQVVASFKDHDVRSILFGTLSYFEGIDLKGDSLTQIILTRLPYSVPTHPIQQILDAKHGYSNWEAIVRYEQAFGRLIRTGYDYGSFNILDNRVSYLRQFIQLFEAENIPITTNIQEIEDFYIRQK